MKLNERIKEMRTLKNMTLLEVAEILGVKEATMQRYESGEIKYKARYCCNDGRYFRLYSLLFNGLER